MIFMKHHRFLLRELPTADMKNELSYTFLLQRKMETFCLQCKRFRLITKKDNTRSKVENNIFFSFFKIEIDLLQKY